MVQVGEIVSEYRLSKSNNSNELTNVNDRHEVAKVSDDTKLVPHKKNYLVEVGKGGIEVFAKTGKALIKVTGHTLTVIGNKLAKIDWGKIALTILKAIFVKEETTYTTQYTTKRSVYRRYTSSQTYNNDENSSQKQVNTSNAETKSIKAEKTQQLEGKKKKSIKTHRAKQIEKQNRNTLNPQQNHLMIEEQKNKKKDR